MMRTIFVAIALTGCNAGGIPPAQLEQSGIYRLTTSVQKDEPTPPAQLPAVGPTDLQGRNGNVMLSVPDLQRREPTFGFLKYELVGGAFSTVQTVCGAQQDILVERLDDGAGLSDTITARLTETWSHVAPADPSCPSYKQLPDTDGQTVATLQFAITERCQDGCASVIIDATGGQHCGACP
jgi:hypothetical protein